MRKVGYFTVDVSTEAEVFIPFKPAFASVEFVDTPSDPPMPSCNPVVEDHCSVEILEARNPFNNREHYMLNIHWEVSRPRKLRWEARKS